MTLLLKKAFAKAQKLPNDEQDRIASLLLAEMESEKKWTAAFEKSQKELSLLAREALEEYKSGKTKPIDQD